MKKFVVTIAVLLAPFLRGAEISLPAKLPAFEDFIVRKLESESVAPPKGKIRVTIAAGHTDIVQRQEEIELPDGATVADAAAELKKKKDQLPLLGWTQGLVVVRRKVGAQVERITWSMRDAGTEAPKYRLRHGDVLIGLLYGDY